MSQVVAGEDALAPSVEDGHMYLCEQRAGEIDHIVHTVVVGGESVWNHVVGRTAVDFVAVDADTVCGSTAIGGGDSDSIADKSIGGCGCWVGNIGAVEVDGGGPAVGDVTGTMRQVGVELNAFAEVDTIAVGPYAKAVDLVVTINDGGVDERTAYRDEPRDVCTLAKSANQGVELRNFREGTEIVSYLYPARTAVGTEYGETSFW